VCRTCKLFSRRAFAIFDRTNIGQDGNRRIAEAIELRLRSRLGRFDHKRTGDRRARCRGAEFGVDEPRRDIVNTRPMRDSAPIYPNFNASIFGFSKLGIVACHRQDAAIPACDD
jgi:hypothetical protein